MELGRDHPPPKPDTLDRISVRIGEDRLRQKFSISRALLGKCLDFPLYCLLLGDIYLDKTRDNIARILEISWKKSEKILDRIDSYLV